MKLLVIDGDEGHRHVVRELSREAGWDVSFGDPGDDITQLRLDRRTFDLVMVTIDDSRIELARLAKQLPDLPVVPVRDGNYPAALETAIAVLRVERRHRTMHEEELAMRVRRLERTNGDLQRIICVDPLTGLANRQHLDNLLATEWARGSRSGTPVSVVMLDLDYFHALNQRYGHLGGDDCLKRVANTMARCLRRPSDILTRYGGEEFVALLPDTDLAGACVVAERLRAMVEHLQQPHETSQCGAVVTVSAGVATAIPQPDRGPETLLAVADAALFHAKESGRNRFCASAELPAMPTVERVPWPAHPVVTAAPYLARRIPSFIERCREAITAVREDLQLAPMLSRELLTTGVSFELEELTDLGIHLGAAIGRNDRDAVMQILDDLSWYLDHVQVVYHTPGSTRRLSEGMAPIRG